MPRRRLRQSSCPSEGFVFRLMSALSLKEYIQLCLTLSESVLCGPTAIYEYSASSLLSLEKLEKPNSLFTDSTGDSKIFLGKFTHFNALFSFPILKDWLCVCF